ncbi:MAG: YggT family protein [Anaerovoracaceae bacterium]|jgi:YggT family protein
MLSLAIGLFGQILIYMIIAEAIMSWFVRPGDRVYPFFLSLRRLTEPLMRPFRNLMGRFGMSMGIDFSPIFAIIAISMIQGILIKMFRLIGM